MISLRKYINAETTIEEVQEIAKDEPEWLKEMRAASVARRSNLRKIIRDEFGKVIADTLLPTGAAVGRPLIAPADDRWRELSRAIRDFINEKKEFDKNKNFELLEKDEWTPEKVSEMTDLIITFYPNIKTSHNLLSIMRHIFFNIGVKDEIIKATARPELTKLYNKEKQEITQKRLAEGIKIPEPFERIGELVNRIDEYLKSDKITGQTAADFLVAFSARPGEAETIELGVQGGVKGMLKKKGDNSEMPLITSIGKEKAEQFLEKWRSYSKVARSHAMNELNELVKKWDIERRDLRAIGALLAVRAARINGEANTEGKAQEFHHMALRHNKEESYSAQEHYMRINDPYAQTIGEFGELTEENKNEISKLIKYMLRNPKIKITINEE